MTEMTTKRRIHKCPRNAPIKRNFINHFTWTSKREGKGHIPKTSLVVTSHTSCPLLNTEVGRFLETNLVIPYAKVRLNKYEDNKMIKNLTKC